MPTTEGERKYVPLIEAEEGTDLDHLMAEFYATKADLKAAEEAHNAIKDKVKLLAMEGRNSDEDTRVDIHSMHGNLAVTYTESMRLNTKRMKEEDPLSYARFCEKRGTWKVQESSHVH